MIKIPSIQTQWHIASFGFGLIISIAIIYLMQYINFALYHIPESVQLHNDEAYSNFIADNPIFLTGNLISSFVGSFFGGAIAVLLRQDISPVYAMGIGAVLMVLGFINILIVSHPAWFNFLSIFVYIPPCWLGAYSIQRIINKTE